MDHLENLHFGECGSLSLNYVDEGLKGRGTSLILHIKVHQSWKPCEATLRFASPQEVNVLSSLALIGIEQEGKVCHWDICKCVTGPLMPLFCKTNLLSFWASRQHWDLHKHSLDVSESVFVYTSFWGQFKKNRWYEQKTKDVKFIQTITNILRLHKDLWICRREYK